MQITNQVSITREQILAMWQKVLHSLATRYGTKVTTNWFSSVAPYYLKNNVLTLAANTEFERKRVLRDYLEDLIQLWKKEIPTLVEVNLVVTKREKMAEQKPTPKKTPRSKTNSIGTRLLPDFCFEKFVVGKPNDFAYNVARAIADSPKVEAKYNPLFLYGGVGLGKTHLMQAIANYKHDHFPDIKVVYMTAERFTTEFISALRHKTMYQFRRDLRSADIFIIDDIQFIARKESTQEEFFHALNEMIENQCQIIASADRLPSDLDGITERVRSRLGWGIVANIFPADFELRFGILQSKAEKMKITLPVEVCEFLADNITTNIRELEGALSRIIAHHQLMGQPLCVEMAREALGDQLRSQERLINIDQIKKQVAEHYNIRISDLLSPSRLQRFSKARQVAMYLCKQLTSFSLPEIGRQFGGRDHTTVLHAVRRITKLKGSDEQINEDLNLITRSLRR